MVEHAESTEPKWSVGDRSRNKLYLREFVSSMVAYVVTLVGALAITGGEPDGAKRWLMLVPMVPVVAAMVAIYRSYRREDEYGKLVQLRGMSLGFAVAIFGLMAIGFLGIIEVGHVSLPWIAFGAAMTTWGLSIPVQMRGAE